MRVVFVDDEPQILRGITRMLDCAEVDWDIDTADSGEQALQLLQQEPADVIVTDMKMPVMDGAELLGEVSRRYPAIVRIVLSGQAEKDAVYRAVSPMHQYLAKPCEAEKLRETISRSCSLRQLLDATGSHEILGRITSLPSLPEIYQKVVAEIESENGTIAKVGEYISQDPAMTAKILQLANSAIFGLRSQVTLPAQAASVIGMDAIRGLVLSLSVFKSFAGTLVDGFNLESFTDHSLQVAGLARHIAKSEKLSPEIVSESFTSGLLHDIGKLILAAHAPEDLGSVIALSQSSKISFIQAERNVLGLGHDQLGGYLLSIWGLPQSIVEGVSFHHTPDQCRLSSLAAPAIVYLANYLSTDSHDREEEVVFNDFVAAMGLAEKVKHWLEGLEQTDVA